MKKNKLNLNELRIESFVTSETDLNTNTVKGGGLYSFDFYCGGTLPASPLCAYTQHSCNHIHCDNYTVLPL